MIMTHRVAEPIEMFNLSIISAFFQNKLTLLQTIKYNDLSREQGTSGVKILPTYRTWQFGITVSC